MDEPRTHYQISLTSGQAAGAFILFAVLLLASYFLGLLTGLSGKGEKASARIAAGAAGPTPSPEPSFPKPVLGVTPRGGRPAPAPSPSPALEPSPAATATIQLFSDRTGAEPTPPPAKAGASKPAAAKAAARPAAKPTETPGFWVQVDSLSSKEQAESRQRGLKAAGFSSTIVPGTGPKGPVYRIRTGPYGTREEAEKAAARLAEKAKVKQPWVVPPGQ